MRQDAATSVQDEGSRVSVTNTVLAVGFTLTLCLLGFAVAGLAAIYWIL